MADGINELINRAEEFMTKAPYLPLGLAKEMIAALKKQQKWISVKDRLPDNASDVLAYYDSECEIRIAPVNYYKGVWYDCVFNRPLDTLGQERITHWMPLPEPPKDGDVG